MDGMMQIAPTVTSAVWADATHQMILADIDGKAQHVPNDPANADRRAIARWEAAGHTIDEAPAPLKEDSAALIRETCEALIAKVFSYKGASQRASMNLWLGCVALKAVGERNADDVECARIGPLLNAWEGALNAEAGRLITEGLTLADAVWPKLPEGAEAFMADCAR